MKLTSLSILALLTLVPPSLSGAIERPKSPTSNLISTLSTKVSVFDSTLASYTGGDPSAVHSASNAIIITMDRGLDDILHGPVLSSPEALSLRPQVQDLIKQIHATIPKITAKRPLLEASCAAATVQKSLNNQYAVSAKLFRRISDKVPDSLLGMAGELAGDIAGAIQGGIDALADASDVCLMAPTPARQVFMRRSANVTNATSEEGGTVSTQLSSSVPVADTSSAAAVGVGIGVGMVGVVVAAVVGVVV